MVRSPDCAYAMPCASVAQLRQHQIKDQDQRNKMVEDGISYCLSALSVGEKSPIHCVYGIRSHLESKAESLKPQAQLNAERAKHVHLVAKEEHEALKEELKAARNQCGAAQNLPFQG